MVSLYILHVAVYTALKSYIDCMDVEYFQAPIMIEFLVLLPGIVGLKCDAEYSCVQLEFCSMLCDLVDMDAPLIMVL